MYEYRKLTPSERRELVEERLARGFPPHQPPDPVRIQGVYLITAACYEHRQHVRQPERRDTLVKLLVGQFAQNGVSVLAWVILTNHYHVLVELNDFTSVSDVVRRVHGSTSRAWNLADRSQGRKVWCRYSDRAMRSEGHYYTTLNYVHFNPVRHSLVRSPYDWQWSSVHWYLQHRGREWLRDTWQLYPLSDYGKAWDDI